jgi:glycosyltransferase involved in cell wall biosynthesis
VSKLVTVITVVLNNKLGLEQTLQSVFKQNYDALEIIVIDGKSTDGTLNVIRQHEKRISCFVSEPDEGVYDAMNKGIVSATGEYILFLNSGDYFAGESSIRSLIEQSDNEDIIYGDIIFKDTSTESVRTYPEVLDFGFFVDSTLPHPCTLIRRSLFSDYGLYDAQIKISADWAFFLKVLGKYNASYKHVSHPVSFFLKGGLSSDLEKVRLEREAYLTQEFNFYYRRYRSLKEYERKVYYLRKSRLIKLFSLVLPKSIKKIIYG